MSMRITFSFCMREKYDKKMSNEYFKSSVESMQFNGERGEGEKLNYTMTQHKTKYLLHSHQFNVICQCLRMNAIKLFEWVNLTLCYVIYVCYVVDWAEFWVINITRELKSPHPNWVPRAITPTNMKLSELNGSFYGVKIYIFMFWFSHSRVVFWGRVTLFHSSS